MKDFIVITYIVALSTSIPVLILIVFNFLGKRSFLTFCYFEFILGAFANTILNTIVYYNLHFNGFINTGDTFFLITFISLIFYSHGIPFIMTSILNIDINKTVNLLFHIHGFFLFICYLINKVFNFTDDHSLYLMSMAYLLVLVTILVIVGLLFNRRISNKYIRFSFIIFSILHLLIFPGYVLQLTKPVTILLTVTKFYQSFSVASLAMFFGIWNICSIIIYIHYLIHSNSSTKSEKNVTSINFDFTKREQEVVELLLRGHSYKKISEELFISLATVKTHVNNIFKKTGTNSKIQLLNFLFPLFNN